MKQTTVLPCPTHGLFRFSQAGKALAVFVLAFVVIFQAGAHVAGANADDGVFEGDTVMGLLRVVVYGAIPINGDGVLLNLRFKAVGSSGAVSPLAFERLLFNDGEPRAALTNGRIELF